MGEMGQWGNARRYLKTVGVLTRDSLCPPHTPTVFTHISAHTTTRFAQCWVLSKEVL